MFSVVAPAKFVLTLQSTPPFVIEGALALALALLLAVPLLTRAQLFEEPLKTVTKIAGLRRSWCEGTYEADSAVVMHHPAPIPVDSASSSNFNLHSGSARKTISTPDFQALRGHRKEEEKVGELDHTLLNPVIDLAFDYKAHRRAAIEVLRRQLDESCGKVLFNSIVKATQKPEVTEKGTGTSLLSDEEKKDIESNTALPFGKQHTANNTPKKTLQSKCRKPPIDAQASLTRDQSEKSPSKTPRNHGIKKELDENTGSNSTSFTKETTRPRSAGTGSKLSHKSAPSPALSPKANSDRSVKFSGRRKILECEGIDRLSGNSASSSEISVHNFGNRNDRSRSSRGSSMASRPVPWMSGNPHGSFNRKYGCGVRKNNGSLTGRPRTAERLTMSSKTQPPSSGTPPRPSSASYLSASRRQNTRRNSLTPESSRNDTPRNNGALAEAITSSGTKQLVDEASYKAARDSDSERSWRIRSGIEGGSIGESGKYANEEPPERRSYANLAKVSCERSRGGVALSSGAELSAEALNTSAPFVSDGNDLDKDLAKLKAEEEAAATNAKTELDGVGVLQKEDGISDGAKSDARTGILRGKKRRILKKSGREDGRYSSQVPRERAGGEELRSKCEFGLADSKAKVSVGENARETMERDTEAKFPRRESKVEPAMQAGLRKCIRKLRQISGDRDSSDISGLTVSLTDAALSDLGLSLSPMELRELKNLLCELERRSELASADFV